MTVVSRRRFLQSTASIPFAACPYTALATGSTNKFELLLVGTRTGSVSKGIYRYHFDAASGDMHPLGLATETESPTFLALGPRSRSVFAINEVSAFQGQASGGISSFHLGRAAARLTPVNERPTRGSGPCHVSVDHTGRCVFAANYGDGSVASFRVDEHGQMSEAVSFFQYTGSGPDTEHQKNRERTA